MVGLMKPKSRGTVRLASADPADAPVVDPNYFAEPADVDAYVAGMELASPSATGAASTHAQSPDQHSARWPGRDRRAHPRQRRHLLSLRRHLRDGPGLSAPVDEMLRVRGVARLRVVDASVMPEVVCCNTHAPTLALAERAAELLLA